MNDFLATLLVLWAMYGSLVFFLVVIVLGFVLPTKFRDRPALTLAVLRVLGSLAGMAVVLSGMMILSQWVLSRYFVDALSVSEMMQGTFIKGLMIYLIIGTPFVLVRTLQLFLRSRKRAVA